MRTVKDAAEMKRVTMIMRLRNTRFVFGSNLAGRHGAGAAKDAVMYYGALVGQGVGPQGTAYALPTKDWRLDPLPLARIATHVADFIDYAEFRPELIFAVTRVGCGLAGFTDEDIAPLFAAAPLNCQLPYGWREYVSPDPR